MVTEPSQAARSLPGGPGPARAQPWATARPSRSTRVMHHRALGPAVASASARSRQVPASRVPYRSAWPGLPERPSQVSAGMVRFTDPPRPPGPAGQPAPGPGDPCGSAAPSGPAGQPAPGPGDPCGFAAPSGLSPRTPEPTDTGPVPAPVSAIPAPPASAAAESAPAEPAAVPAAPLAA